MKISVLRKKTEPVCAGLFNGLCVLLFAFLFGNSLVSSWMNHALSDEYVYREQDNLPANLLLLLAALAGLAALFRLARGRITRQNIDRLAVIVSVLSVFISVAWVLASKTMPQADQEEVWRYAVAFNSGDYSGLARGGYVGVYRQQLGIITILRVLDFAASVLHTEGWFLFQLFSALTTGVLVYSGFRVVKLLTDGNTETELLYLLLAFVCAPMYIYTAFVYGESGSTAFAMMAAWMLLECLKAFRLRYLAGLYLSAGLAVMLRTNTLVVMIAFGVVLAVKLVQAADRWRVAVAAALLLAVLTPTLVLNVLYGDKTPADSKPMPAIMHITMGINGEAGWYNAYNIEQYRANGYDPQAAAQVAKRDLASFLSNCKARPSYALGFYYRKISTQWNAPMYQCIAMNNRIEGEQPRLVRSLYEGRANRWLTGYMNIYQLLVYGGVLAFAVLALKRRGPLENELLLIAVFGGFLFSILWEAKTRYVYPYFILMIPYAAAGIGALCAACWRRWEQKQKK